MTGEPTYTISKERKNSIRKGNPATAEAVITCMP